MNSTNTKHEAIDDAASLDIGACSLCHCALDFSDRAAFFPADRWEDYTNNDDDDDSSFFFRKHDPYLPSALYHPHNALVYCDTCPRLFHQLCHFVPILVLPRGPWHCFVCVSQQAAAAAAAAGKVPNQTKKSPAPKRSHRNKKEKTSSISITSSIMSEPLVLDYSTLFTSPPFVAATTATATATTTATITHTTKKDAIATRHGERL